MNLRHVFISVALLAIAVSLPAQEAGPRAWQQRLAVDIPLPVPVVELASVNPFSREIDQLPTLLGSTPPRKLAVAGNAEIAAYVNAKGDCLGAVPLRSPFPGLTSTLVAECGDGRYDPARIGSNPVPTWGVFAMTLSGTVKESSVIDGQLDLPESTRPPVPAPENRTYPSSRLLSLQATDPASVTSPIVVNRLRIRTPSREYDIPLRALVHITADGRCDRYVPLEVDAGFDLWLSAFLNTWRLEPARFEGKAVDCWLIYTARARIKLNRIVSTRAWVLRDRAYQPATDTPPEG